MNTASTPAGPGKVRWIWALLACLLAAGCSRTTMFSELEERQANEVLAALLASGVNADKRPSASKTGWEIRVDQGDFAQAQYVLQSRGLPRTQFVSLCDVFKKEGFASSAVEEKARYICSRQQELAKTLTGYPGVVDARVHIALPDRDPLGGETGESSAAVVIFEQPGANLQNLQTRIKTVVKDGIEGLDDINKVSVEFVQMQGMRPVSEPPAGRSGSPIAMSAANATSIGIGVAALAAIALVVALWGRLRQRREKPADNDRLWKG